MRMLFNNKKMTKALSLLTIIGVLGAAFIGYYYSKMYTEMNKELT